MYPYDILPGIDLYVICLGLAAVAAILSFSKLADIVKIRGKVQNMTVYTAIAAIVLGYGSAVLFQAFYNMLDKGSFSIDSSTGATFYGGLIGGVISFIAIYFIWGKISFKDDDTYKKQFALVANVAPAAITVAHALGRIGCLMAGCCYGAKTDAWYGIKMQHLGYKVVPTQLFEAIFLLLLFLLFVYRILKGKGYNLPIYMIAYAVWRFLLEYIRNDYRGETVVSFLTPSQLIAAFMVIGGIVLIVIMKKLDVKRVSVTNEDNSDE